MSYVKRVDLGANKSEGDARGCPGSCNTPQNRMTVKERETEQDHLSNNLGSAGQGASAKCEPEVIMPSAGSGKERSRNWGWMLSGVITVNILILGCALVSGSAFNTVGVDTSHVQIFLIVLILPTIAWMLFYCFHTSRQENAVLYKDGHAGPVWLRAGLVLFGLLSIIMDIFKIASYVGYLHCESGVKVAFPIIQLIFIVVQSYFLWLHSKDCVQLQKIFTRCGLMLTLSTNLVIWMAMVTEESLHQTTSPEEPYENVTKGSGRMSYISRASYGDDKCKCSHSSCKIFKEAYYYLYPFNIEYCLFASAMAYVMWKNVGRVTEEHSHHHSQFRVKDVYLGTVAGILLVVAGLATFIVYEVNVEKDDDDKKDNALMMHFVMNIVIVILMSIATIIGSAVYRMDHRDHMYEKNPTRTLDVALLVGASLGQFIISYFSIVAMVGTRAKGYLDRLNLVWAIAMVIQLGLQNFFIIEGLHREPFHEDELSSVFSNPYVLQPGKELGNIEGSDPDTKPSQEVPAHNHVEEHKHKLSWKRRVLKEVCVFLLLGNVILWIMPAFGARPQFDHETETDFYKFSMWAAIVNIGLPFGIFYRMHSVAALFEVFVIA